MSIRWCKENANIRICSMIFYTLKNCGILEILGLIMRDACGVVLIRLEYHTMTGTATRFFGNLCLNISMEPSSALSVITANHIVYASRHFANTPYRNFENLTRE